MGRVIGRLRGGSSAALLMVLVAAGALLTLINASPVLSFAPAILFGISFLAVVAAVTHAARTALAPTRWTAGAVILTTGFALGQCIGPVLSGLWRTRQTGPFRDAAIGRRPRDRLSHRAHASLSAPERRVARARANCCLSAGC